MNHQSANLLDEALELDQVHAKGRILHIEDCVETSGAFILHHLIRRCLSHSPSDVVVLVAFFQPFSHYDRILRKMGCNLVVQRDNNRFFFLDMLMLECPDGDEVKTKEGWLVTLYGKIREAVEVNADSGKRVTIMIDDLSLMEVAANGSSNHMLDFLHYCHTLSSEFDCSLVTLNHEDIYSSEEGPTLLLHMEYLADILIKAEPLATGLATDVHGQLTVLNKGNLDGQRNKMTRNFHFKVKETCVECFYRGTRT